MTAKTGDMSQVEKNSLFEKETPTNLGKCNVNCDDPFNVGGAPPKGGEVEEQATPKGKKSSFQPWESAQCFKTSTAKDQKIAILLSKSWSSQKKQLSSNSAN